MKNLIRIFTVILIVHGKLSSQPIPFEVFTGNKKYSFDVMAMKHTYIQSDSIADILFFSRARAVSDYQEGEEKILPQFALTQAFGYKVQKFKGFTPVFVVQLFNRGTFFKPGISYLKATKKFTFFSWTVIELKENPYIDFFVLTRYTPKLTDRLNGFIQVELLNNFPTQKNNAIQLTQRARLGLKTGRSQFGFAADFSEVINKNTKPMDNLGLFIRHEF